MSYRNHRAKIKNPPGNDSNVSRFNAGNWNWRFKSSPVALKWHSSGISSSTLEIQPINAGFGSKMKFPQSQSGPRVQILCSGSELWWLYQVRVQLLKERESRTLDPPSVRCEDGDKFLHVSLRRVARAFPIRPSNSPGDSEPVTIRPRPRHLPQHQSGPHQATGGWQSGSPRPL